MDKFEKELKGLPIELQRLRIKKQALGKDIRDAEKELGIVNDSVDRVKEDKNKVLNKYKEDQIKLTSINDDIKIARGNLVKVMKEGDAKIAEIKESQDRLDENARELSIKEDKFEKDKAKAKEEAVGIVKGKAAIANGLEKNKQNEARIAEGEIKLEKDRKKLLKEEEAIDARVTEATDDRDKTKALRCSVKEKKDMLVKALEESGKEKRYLSIKKEESDTLIEKNKKLGEELKEKSEALDTEKKSLDGMYEDINRKNQELDLRRLKLLKIAKGKDLKKQIEELEKEDN